MTAPAADQRDPKGWFLTYTGRQFWPCDPRSEDISILDIAHHLANICRFGGACKPFYSVAQHSVHVSHIGSGVSARIKLMHDAPEAYAGDIVRPLKYHPSFDFYFQIEAALWKVISGRFGLGVDDPKKVSDVAWADDAALMTERRDLMVKSPHKWSVKARPVAERIRPLAPQSAEQLFINRFIELWGKEEFELLS